MNEKRDEETKKPVSFGNLLREVGQSFKRGWDEAVKAREAEQAKGNSAPPAANPTEDDVVRIDRLLRSWSGPGAKDRPA